MRYTIEQDTDVEDPRVDYDNLGVMVCFHKRYNLGDKHPYKEDMFNGWNELREQLVKPLEEDGEGALHILPLYLMDHSGLSISTGDFQDRWDSGQVGFIYTTAEHIKAMGLEGASAEQLEKALRTEVTVYDQYLSGDVWYYTIEDDNGEVLDSCSGLYGHDYAEQEAEEALKYLQAQKKRTALVQHSAERPAPGVFFLDPHHPERAHCWLDSAHQLTVNRTDEGVVLDVWDEKGEESLWSAYFFDSELIP